MPAARNTVGVRSIVIHETRSDHHFAIALLQRLEDGGNIARIVLPVAVDADHVVVTEFIRQTISGLYAAAQA